MVTRRRVLIGGGVAAAVAGIGGGVIIARSGVNRGDGSLRRLSVRFPIPTIESGQATFYVADQIGAYRNQGLAVSFELGSPETNPVRMVTAGTDDIGVLGGPDTLLVARGRAAPLKAIAIIHRKSNFTCLVTKTSSGITSISQLEGKRVGFFYGHISTDVLRALFKRSKVTVIEVDTGFSYSSFIAGQIDASWAFTVTAGLELPAHGQQINIISPAEYGIVTHGYTIFATDETIRNRHSEVLAFLKASLAGVSQTMATPTQAVALMHQKSPQTKVDLLIRRQAAYNAVTSNSAAFPPGYMDRQMWQETYDRLAAVGSIAQPFDVASAYTTEFLEEIHGKKFD